jgi:hypothetical protein
VIFVIDFQTGVPAMLKAVCSKCLRRACICGVIFCRNPLCIEGFRLTTRPHSGQSNGRAELFFDTSISVGDPMIYNEISGDEYSTPPVHEQHALRALRTTGPFTFKPEVLKQMAAARAQSSDDLDAVFFPPLVRVPKVG